MDLQETKKYIGYEFILGSKTGPAKSRGIRTIGGFKNDLAEYPDEWMIKNEWEAYMIGPSKVIMQLEFKL